MKTFELKVVPFEAFGNKEELDYKSMLQTLIELPENQERGSSIDEIRKSMRILDALEDSDGHLQLEDADAAYLARRVNAAKFTSNNRVFVDFVDHFTQE